MTYAALDGPISRSPWMDEELTLLGDAAGKFFDREFAPHWAAWEKAGNVPKSAWEKAGAAGLLCASIPDRYGGGGGDYRHDAVIVREQARRGFGAMMMSVHSTIVAHYLNAYGSEEQKTKWLPKLASGEWVGAVAMTEPGAGSDLQGVRATARRDGNHYVLNGQKTFISNGQHAGLIVVVAKTDPTAGARGVSLIVVEPSEVDAGFRRGRNLDKIGQHAGDTSELFFDDVRVPTANLLGAEEGQGFAQLMNQLPQERLILADGGVAAAERAVALTTAYVKERKAFGKTLMDFQNTRFKLAECRTKVEVTRAFVDKCVALHLDGELDAATAAMAKYWASEVENDVIDECLQLFGGYGYMTEYPIARMFCDARVQKIYGGANEIMKELIARAL